MCLYAFEISLMVFENVSTENTDWASKHGSRLFFKLILQKRKTKNQKYRTPISMDVAKTGPQMPFFICPVRKC